MPTGWSTLQHSLMSQCYMVMPDEALTYHSIFVRLTHEYGFSTGLNVPGIQVKRPVSWKKLSNELQPGPPLRKMVTSSTGGPIVGWKMKNRALLMLL